MRDTKKFSTSISQVNNSTRKHGLSIGRLFKLLDRRSNYILTFVSFFLLVLPLPTPPGFSIVLALPAIFITSQICFINERIWIPKWLVKLRINKKIVKTIDKSSRKYLNFIEKKTKKRFTFIVSPKTHKFYNIVLLVLSLFSAIPIPLLCMIPAIAGVLLSAGLIVKDGLIVLISLFIGFTGISVLYFAIQTLFFINEYIPI